MGARAGDTSHFIELSKGPNNDMHPWSSGLLPRLLEEDHSKCVCSGKMQGLGVGVGGLLLNASGNYSHPGTLSPVSSHNPAEF